MGASNSEQNQKALVFYSLKAKVDATNDPHFAKTEKVSGKWETTETFTNMSGVITKAELVEKELQDGTKYNAFKFYFSDSNETSVVEMTHNSVTYNILNSLSSEFDPSKEVSISLYKTSSTGKDGKTYWNGKAGVKSDNESLNWSVPGVELPRAEQIFIDGEKKTKPLLVSGKKVYEHEPVKSFWEELFNTKIKDKFSSKNAPSQLPKAVGEDLFANEDSEDLPF